MLPTQAWAAAYLLAGPEGLGFAPAAAGLSLLPAFNTAAFLAGRRPLHAAAYALALPPLFAGAAGACAFGAGCDPRIATLVPALATLPLAAWAGARPPRGAEPRDAGLLVAFAAGALFAGFTAFLLFTSENLRVSMHGLLHASVAYRIMDTGLPPENPFFAGHPLPYYWFYHLAAAGLALGGQGSPLLAFAFMNTLAAFAVPPLLYLAARGMGLAVREALLGAALGLLALNPLGPFFFVLQEPSVSYAEVEHGLFPGYLVRFMALGFDLRLASPLTKFWNVSSFAPSLPLFLTGLAACTTGGRLSGARPWILFLSAAGLLLVNPITALAFFPAAAAAGAAGFGRPGGRGRCLAILGLLAAAGLLTTPYLAAMAGDARSGGLVGFAASGVHLLGALLAAGPLLLFAGFGAAREVRAGNRGGIATTLFCASILFLALFLALPEGNEYKLFRLLVLPAGLLAAPAVKGFWKRLGVPPAAWIPLTAGVLLANPLLAGSAYLAAGRHPLPLADAKIDLDLQDGPQGRGATYRFLLGSTPRDAVLVVDPAFQGTRGLGGPFQGDEAAALSRRPLYTATGFYLTERVPGFADRLARVEALFSGKRGPYPEPVGKRPLYLLVRNGTLPPSPGADRFEEIFRNGTSAVYRFRKE